LPAKRNAGFTISTAGSVPAPPAADRRSVASVVVVTVIAARTAAATAERSTSATTATATRGSRCRGAGVERDHSQNLNPFSTLPNLAMDRRAFRRVLQSGFLQCGDMEEDVRRTIRRRDEAETLFRIEPLDTPFKLGATLLALIGHFDHSDSCRAFMALQDRRYAHDPPDAGMPAGSMGVSPPKSKTPLIGVDYAAAAEFASPELLSMLKLANHNTQ